MEIKAAYATSILLQLKEFLRIAYRLDSERIANFSPYGTLLSDQKQISQNGKKHFVMIRQPDYFPGEKRKNEERNACSRAKASSLVLAPVPIGAFSSLQVSFYTLSLSDNIDSVYF